MQLLPVLQNRPTDPPECFGSHLWDPRSSECSGGADITYTHPGTGSHVRPKCDFFAACGAKVQALRSTAQRAMVPVTPTFPTPFRPAASGAIARMQTPPMSQQMQQVQPQQMMVPMQMQGPYYPATTYQFNHGIPGYLSVPEPRLPGESVWTVLLREVLRGLLKSAGHSVSYFVDQHPLKNPPTPPSGE